MVTRAADLLNRLQTIEEQNFNGNGNEGDNDTSAMTVEDEENTDAEEGEEESPFNKKNRNPDGTLKPNGGGVLNDRGRKGKKKP
jgi:hypothetical protein